MTTPTTVNNDSAKEEAPASGSVAFDQPPTPLHGHNWQECQPLCPCGESQPASMSDTALPIREPSSSQDVASPHVHEIVEDDSGYHDFICSHCGSQLEGEELKGAMNRFWDSVTWEDDPTWWRRGEEPTDTGNASSAELEQRSGEDARRALEFEDRNSGSDGNAILSPDSSYQAGSSR